LYKNKDCIKMHRRLKNTTVFIRLSDIKRG